jgi:tryptophan synthase alpha chain
VNRYAAMFERLTDERAGAFGAFLMLGDPDLETSGGLIDSAVEGGADLIEVGFPFSDPVADGPVIQASAERALRQNVRQEDCFALLESLRQRHPRVPIGILTYANLVVTRGRETFYRQAAAAGVDSVLIADVPSLEAEPFATSARVAGIDPVLIAAVNSPPATLQRIARLGGGYTYCLARSGVTGPGEEVHFEHRSMLEALAAASAPPPIFGFGISRPGHVRAAIEAGAAGAICGSAIVRLAAENRASAPTALRRFVAEMKSATIRSG